MDDDGGIKNYYGYVNKLRPPRFVEPRRGLVKAMARRAKMSHLGRFRSYPSTSYSRALRGYRVKTTTPLRIARPAFEH